MKIWVLNPPFLAKYSRPQRSPAVTKSGTLYFPIWLAYCAGVLEEAGHDVTFTDAPARGITHEQVVRQAQTLAPGMVVMDTSTPSIQNDIRVCEELKKVVPQAFIVLVGTHVSALAEETLGKSPAIDAVARREYEFTIRDLAALIAGSDGRRPDAEGLGRIAGLSFRLESGPVHNGDRAFIEDLDALPWVSKTFRKHLCIRDYFNPNALYPMVTLITSRGCPFRCSFCVYPQTLTGRKYRFRSIEDVVDEMEYVVREFPDVRCIFFEDDTLTANRKRCLAFSEAVLARGLNVPWTANSRIDLDLATMRKMKEAGCRELCVGFESGDQDVLDSMHKGTRLERMKEFMRDAHRAGILIHGCFMLGFPGESGVSIRKTIDLAIQLGPDTVQFYPVMVYPGTEAFDEYVQKDWLTARDYDEWLTGEGLHNCVVRNEEFSSADLVRLCDGGRRRFYLRPGYIAYKLLQVARHPSDATRTAKAARTFFKHLIRGSKV